MDLSKFKNITKEEYLAMPQEQRAAVRQALSQKQQDNQVLIDQATVETSSQQIPNEIKNSNIKASLVGTAQGAGFGFMDEIASAALATQHAVETTKEALSKQGMAGFDNFLPTWQETYNKAHDGFQEAITDLKKKHPDSFENAYMAGSALSGMALGATSLGQLASKSLVGQLGIMGGEGFLHGVGNSNAETLGGVAMAGLGGAGSTAAVGGAVIGAGKTIQGAGKLAGKLFPSVTEALMPEKLIKYFSGDMKKFIDETDIYKKQEIAEFANRAVNYTDEKGNWLLTPFQNAEKAQEAVQRSLVDTGKTMGKIIGTIEESGILPQSDIDVLFNSIKRDIIDDIAEDSTSNIVSQNSIRLQEGMRKRLTEEFFMVDPDGATLSLADEVIAGSGASVKEIPKMIMRPWTLSGLVKYKNALSKEIPKKLQEGGLAAEKAEVLKKVRNRVHNFVREEIESVSHKLPIEGSDELYSIYKQASTKYNDLLDLDRLLTKKLKNPDGLSAYAKIFKESWGKVTLGAAAASYMLGVQGTAVGAGIGALALMATNPRLNKAVSLSLNRIVNAAKDNPGKYEKYINRVAVSADVSGKAFFENITRLGAEVDLGEQPINRTTEDLVNRQDSLLAIAGDVDPELRRMLDDAIKTGDSNIYGTMILNTPQLSKYVSKGLGWDGIAITDSDKQAVGSYLQTLKPKARKFHTEQFMKTNMIPEDMLTNKPAEPEKVIKFKKFRNKVSKPRF